MYIVKDRSGIFKGQYTVRVFRPDPFGGSSVVLAFFKIRQEARDYIKKKSDSSLTAKAS